MRCIATKFLGNYPPTESKDSLLQTMYSDMYFNQPLLMLLTLQNVSHMSRPNESCSYSYNNRAMSLLVRLLQRYSSKLAVLFLDGCISVEVTAVSLLHAFGDCFPRNLADLLVISAIGVVL